MKPACAIAFFLLIAAFSMATDLTQRHRAWSGDKDESTGFLTAVLGDSRRLFAKYIYAKADAYFHSGYYPSMFDKEQQKPDGFALSAAADEHVDEHGKDAHAHHDHGDSETDHAACEFLGEPRDWLDRFSRNFFPSEHRHLGEDPAVTATPGTAAGSEREILPWFRLAAEMDPDRPETYVVAAYWLRSRLGRINEAEQFLREGLRANPSHPELLFELARIYEENHHDARRACNIWEMALAKLPAVGDSQDDNLLLRAQLLGNLAKAEEQLQNVPEALRHLTALKLISPHKESIRKWMEELMTKASGAPRAAPAPDHDHDHDHGLRD